MVCVVIEPPQPIGVEGVFGVVRGKRFENRPGPIRMRDLDVGHGQRELKAGVQRTDGIGFLPGDCGVEIVVVQKVDAAQIRQQGSSSRGMRIRLDLVDQQLFGVKIVVGGERRLQVRYFFRSQIQRRRRSGDRRRCIARALGQRRGNPGVTEEESQRNSGRRSTPGQSHEQ